MAVADCTWRRYGRGHQSPFIHHLVHDSFSFLTCEVLRGGRVSGALLAIAQIIPTPTMQPPLEHLSALFQLSRSICLRRLLLHSDHASARGPLQLSIQATSNHILMMHSSAGPSAPETAPDVHATFLQQVRACSHRILLLSLVKVLLECLGADAALPCEGGEPH